MVRCFSTRRQSCWLWLAWPCFSFHMANSAASGEPAAAIRAAMSGGLLVPTSWDWDGRGAWPGGGRGAGAGAGAAEALDAAESMDRLREGAVGFVSGR